MSPVQEQRIVSVLDALLVELRSVYGPEGHVATVAESEEREPARSLMMTADELAQELQLNVRTLRRMRLAGELPEPLQFGTRVRWRRADIEKWIAGREK